MEQEPGIDTGRRDDAGVSEGAEIQAASYRIDDLVIDVGRGQVTRADEEVPLPKLSFDLLLALADAAPNLASIDGLMTRVWPGLVVSPETVSQRVKLLRSALGDDPKHPHYIVGVRGRGYRLLPEVVRTDSMHHSKTGRTPARRAARWITFGAACAVVLAVSAGIVFWRGGNEGPSNSQPAAPAAQQIPARSVAVLPFENLSSATDDKLLAMGMAEAVLHQLANLSDLVVIARTSSFALRDPGDDARTIGRRLNARYLLEGSVQSEKQQLRVTAQLIDSETGSHVWSMRFDRTLEDIFAVQDEIATRVAGALASSVDANARPGLAQRGTEKLDAWLPYLQGRALMATRRLADLDQARERFAEAIRVDPSFASAYVALAETQLVAAYFPLSELWFINGPFMPAAARTEIEQLLSRALALDEKNGEAHVLRAWMQRDRLTAEADYRRGLALSPNSALGYERLARLLFYFPDQGGTPDPVRRAESFVLIDRARELDPLVPSAHLTKGMMVLYGRGDTKAANALILQALEQDPNYYPALVRLAELRACCEGKFAEAIRYAERALAMEPNASWPRRFLVHFYLDVNEPDSAKQVIAESRESDLVGQVPVYLYERQWRKAGELAFTVNSPLGGIERNSFIWAISQYARATAQAARTREILENIAGIDWSAPGEPAIHDDTHDNSASIALAAMLLSSGEETRGRLLLRAALRESMREAHELGRGEMWYGFTNPQALALLGEADAAIDALRASFDAGFMGSWWYRLERETAYDALRHDPRFVALLAQAKAHAAVQRAQLDAMRVAGTVPTRVARAAGVSSTR